MSDRGLRFAPLPEPPAGLFDETRGVLAHLNGVLGALNQSLGAHTAATALSPAANARWWSAVLLAALVGHSVALVGVAVARAQYAQEPPGWVSTAMAALVAAALLSAQRLRFASAAQHARDLERVAAACAALSASYGRDTHLRVAREPPGGVLVLYVRLVLRSPS